MLARTQENESPRCSCSIEELTSRTLSRLERSASSGGDPDGGIVIEYGLGLLALAKSDKDAVFRVVVTSMGSSPNTKEQVRRALCRWAASNRREHVYSALARKANTVCLAKGKAIVNHFKSIPGGEGSSGAVRAVRLVSDSLLLLVEARIAVLQNARPRSSEVLPKVTPPAQSSAPSAGGAEDEVEERLRQIAPGSTRALSPVNPYKTTHLPELQQQSEVDTVPPPPMFNPGCAPPPLMVKTSPIGRSSFANTNTNTNTNTPTYSPRCNSNATSDPDVVISSLAQLQDTVSAGFMEIRTRQDVMEKQLQCMGRSLDLIIELVSTSKKQRGVGDVAKTTKEAVSGAAATEDESSVVKEVVGESAGKEEGKTCEEARTIGMTSMGGAIKFELSEQERQMNGAPKGDIFLAAAKQTRELEASLNVGEDKKAIIVAQRAVKEGMNLKWANLFVAVDSGRRLLTHHYPEAFTGDGEDLLGISMLVTLAVEASKRPETNCSRNGLFLMENMLRSPKGKEIDPDDVAKMVKEALRHAVSDKGFMVKAGKEVMDMAVTSVNTLSLLTAIVPHCATSGFKMAEEGVVYASKCLGVMSKDELIGRKDGRKKIDVGELVAAMSRGLHGKSKQAKTSAKEGLTRVKELVGDKMEEVIVASLGDTPDLAREVRTTLARASLKTQAKDKHPPETGSSTTRDKPWRKSRAKTSGCVAGVMRAGRAKEREGLWNRDENMVEEQARGERETVGADSVCIGDGKTWKGKGLHNIVEVGLVDRGMVNGPAMVEQKAGTSSGTNEAAGGHGMEVKQRGVEGCDG